MIALIVDGNGQRLATTRSEGVIERALKRREITRTETPGLFRLAEHADRLLVSPGLTHRQRVLRENRGRR